MGKREKVWVFFLTLRASTFSVTERFCIPAGMRRRRFSEGCGDGVERRGSDLGLDLSAPGYWPSFPVLQEAEEYGSSIAFVVSHSRFLSLASTALLLWWVHSSWRLLCQEAVLSLESGHSSSISISEWIWNEPSRRGFIVFRKETTARRG